VTAMSRASLSSKRKENKNKNKIPIKSENKRKKNKNGSCPKHPITRLVFMPKQRNANSTLSQ